MTRKNNKKIKRKKIKKNDKIDKVQTAPTIQKKNPKRHSKSLDELRNINRSRRKNKSLLKDIKELCGSITTLNLGDDKEELQEKLQEESQEALQCLENDKEMGVQETIKNNDDLKNHICNELSHPSSQDMKTKKRSATKRLQNWIQHDKYPSMTLEQAEKVVDKLRLNLGKQVLVT